MDVIEYISKNDYNNNNSVRKVIVAIQSFREQLLHKLFTARNNFKQIYSGCRFDNVSFTYPRVFYSST